MPLVSVIIPVYNRERLIVETLESVKAQTMEEWECIIVDDSSTDNTEKEIRSFTESESRFRFYKRPADRLKGANSCRNIGFEKAKGKYLKFLDSDDLLLTDCLQKQVKVLEENSKIQVCFSYGKYFNIKTRELEEAWSRNTKYYDYLSGHITNQIRWAISDPLWRASFFEKAPFREGLMNSQEWLMHGEALLKLKKEEIFNMQETFTIIRRGNLRMSSSQSSKYYKNQKLARIYLLKKLIAYKKVHLSYYYQLIKQIFVYYFWELRQKYFEKN